MDQYGNNKYQTPFHEEQRYPRSYVRPVRSTGLIGVFIKISGGVIKTEQQANVVLLVCALLMLLFSFLMFTSLGGQPFAEEDIIPSDPPVTTG